jgi:hypothetical protein
MQQHRAHSDKFRTLLALQQRFEADHKARKQRAKIAAYERTKKYLPRYKYKNITPAQMRAVLILAKTGCLAPDEFTEGKPRIYRPQKYFDGHIVVFAPTVDSIIGEFARDEEGLIYPTFEAYQTLKEFMENDAHKVHKVIGCRYSERVRMGFCNPVVAP